MSDEGPHAEPAPEERRRTRINDVQHTTSWRRRIAMTIDEPQWRLSDVRAFVEHAEASGADPDAVVFFGTFHAEVAGLPENRTESTVEQ